ncbi:MAG: hypothetical protein J6X44_01015, partial [Thermoguttaceae bacterium]|nr:hypothetical protein [Thermoguttaceae bacterium]
PDSSPRLAALRAGRGADISAPDSDQRERFFLSARKREPPVRLRTAALFWKQRRCVALLGNTKQIVHRYGPLEHCGRNSSPKIGVLTVSGEPFYQLFVVPQALFRGGEKDGKSTRRLARRFL